MKDLGWAISLEAVSEAPCTEDAIGDFLDELLEYGGIVSGGEKWTRTVRRSPSGERTSTPAARCHAASGS